MNVLGELASAGGICLFPFLGEIEKLNNFFPKGYKRWFVTFSSIFSLIVYIIFLDQFKYVSNVLSINMFIIAAFVLLLFYVLIRLLVFNKMSPDSKDKNPPMIIVQLIIYCAMIANFTYIFNFLEFIMSYDIYKGAFKYYAEGYKEPVPLSSYTKIIIELNGEKKSDEFSVKSRKDGSFTIIEKKGKLKSIETEWCINERKDCYHIFKNRDQLILWHNKDDINDLNLRKLREEGD